MWAHESRADLEPLRFSTHERSGVGSERVSGEQFSQIFLLGFGLENFGYNSCFAVCLSLFLFTYFLIEWLAGHCVWDSFK